MAENKEAVRKMEETVEASGDEREMESELEEVLDSVPPRAPKSD